MNSLLIIFVKNPELGKVKSRLAKSIGMKKALCVYKKLLERTKEIVTPIDCDKVVCYSDKIEMNDIWGNDNFLKSVQQGLNLGDKMFNSIQKASNDSYSRICLIGSDNMEITSDIIVSAFEHLRTNDVVLGPANDGGYYLIGMKNPINKIFKNKNWGTASVLEETVKDLNILKLAYILLPELNDIDVIEDMQDGDRKYLLT